VLVYHRVTSTEKFFRNFWRKGLTSDDNMYILRKQGVSMKRKRLGRAGSWVKKVLKEIKEEIEFRKDCDKQREKFLKPGLDK